MPLIIPLNTPCLLIESIMYWEHEGEKRQEEAKNNESVFWYNLIRRIKKNLIIKLLSHFIKGCTNCRPSYILLIGCNYQSVYKAIFN